MVKPKNIDMKVICIESPYARLTDFGGKTLEPKYTPVVGETYTVVDEEDCSGIIFYQLAEFPSDEGLYQQDLFAPLSNIDERVIHNIKADEIFSELEVSEG
jgi:hypothetical protein